MKKIIETERCIIQDVTIENKNEIYNILSNKEVNENLNIEKPVDEKVIENLMLKYESEYKKGTYEPLAIIDKANKNFIGVILLKLDLYNDDAYEYTSYINPNYKNKGITTEVLKEVTKYFFENYKQNNFRGYIMTKNIASKRVLEKNNFALEKIFNVKGLGEIYSYLMTRENFKKIYKI